MTSKLYFKKLFNVLSFICKSSHNKSRFRSILWRKKNICSGICTSLCSSSVVTLKMPCFFLSSAIWFGLLLGQLMVHGSKMSKKDSGNMKERLRDCWNYVPLRNYLTIKHSYWISLEISMRQSIRQLKKFLRKELISINLNKIPDPQITKAVVLIMNGL